MPSRFFDYESDLLHSSNHDREDKPKTGFRRSTETKHNRQNSTSESTSTTTTRSSFSSTATSGAMLSSTSQLWRPGHHANRSTGGILANTSNHKLRDPHREEQVEPTEQIQAWAHQTHIQQQRQYWWCSSCHPKTPALQVPSQKAMKRVRIAEPSHAYE